MTLAEFVNKLIWQTEGKGELDAFNKGLEDIGRNAGRVARRGIIAAGAASTAFLGLSFRAAAAAEELDSQLGVVFGDNADRVNEWAETTGNALSRSTQEIQRSAVAFQSLFGQAIGGDEAIQLAQDFSVLTQDLASFKDLSNEVAQQKLFSGLSGEAEPLRQVGVFINAAATEAKALELGLARTAKELTDQNKIVARAALIQEALSDASGDVIRTQESATNQIKATRAVIEELTTSIGQDLLPIITPLIKRVAEFVGWLSDFNRRSGGTITNILLISAGLAGLLIVLSPFVTVFTGIAKAIAVYNAAVVAGTIVTGTFTAVALPIIAIILAITAAITAIVLVWKNWDKIVAAFNKRLSRLRRDAPKIFAALVIGAQTVGAPFRAVLMVINKIIAASQVAISLAKRASDFVQSRPEILAAGVAASNPLVAAGVAARAVVNNNRSSRTAVTQSIKNEINVRGGPSNAGTGRAVRDALSGGQYASRINGNLVGPVGF